MVIKIGTFVSYTSILHRVEIWGEVITFSLKNGYARVKIVHPINLSGTIEKILLKHLGLLPESMAPMIAIDLVGQIKRLEKKIKRLEGTRPGNRRSLEHIFARKSYKPMFSR